MGLCSWPHSVTAHRGQQTCFRVPSISTTVRSRSLIGRRQNPHSSTLLRELNSCQPRPSIASTINPSTTSPVFFLVLIVASLMLHSAHSVFQTAFGVNEKVSRNHNFLPLLQAREQDGLVAYLGSDGDLSGFKHALIVRNENKLFRP